MRRVRPCPFTFGPAAKAGRTWLRPLLATLLCAQWLAGCGAAAQTFRLNPEQEPEQYRVTCAKRFRFCQLEAEKVCGGEYVELERLSNRPEMPTIEQSDVSSAGPSMGLPDWKGELTIKCGRDLPALALERPEPTKAVTTPTSAVSSGVTSGAGSERVCIPGETQACLGPGACSGAQACLTQGQGFGPCDCGGGSDERTPSPANSAAPSSAPPGTDAVVAPTQPASVPAANNGP